MKTKSKFSYLSAAILIIFLLSSTNINAQQLQPDFTVDTVSGCIPVVINFTNTSQPDTNVSYYWDFGNGTISTLKNPSTIYITPGQYSVSLTISDSLSSNTIVKENLIEVFGSPSANFTVSENNGCLPFSVELTDSSELAQSEITYWLWNFGDGNYSELPNADHTYVSTGSFTVSLYIEDANGCNSQITVNNIVNVHKPNANFNAQNLFSCDEELLTDFQNLSSGDSTLSCLWSFGDGINSGLQNPSHLYVDTGSFDVQLIVEDFYGCSDTLVQYDLVEKRTVSAAFEISNNVVCKNQPIFTINTSTNSDNYLWDFGDNSTSTDFEPSHTYSQSGPYDITLTTTNSYGCVDSFSKHISISYVNANFEVDRNYLCQLPDSVHYIDLSENGEYFEWHLGNGIISYEANPTVVFESPGIFSDTLIVFNKYGCRDEYIVDSCVRVQIPHAYFTPNNWVNPFDFMGCVPLTVDFEDNSKYVVPNDSVIAWSWNFGDGSTSIEQNPSHTFTTLDNFLVELTVTTSLGCTSQYGGWARTGTKQHASFTSTAPDTVCASTGVPFFNTSEVDSLVNYTFWIFGDSTFSSQRNPVHFFEDTGYIDVKLIAYNNGCPDDTLIENFIYVKGPYLNFEIEQDCSNPFDVLLLPNFIDTTNFYWDFGDGSEIDSINASPNHLYAIKDTFAISLFTENLNTGCSYSVTADVLIVEADGDFELSDTIVCVNDTVAFDASLSKDLVAFYHNQQICNFLWDFGDQTEKLATFDTIVTHKFTSEGDFEVKLIGFDLNGCSDTTIKIVHVHKPNPGFYADFVDGCSPLQISFVDTSYSAYNLINYFWDFGNGDTSNLQNPICNYYNVGNYSVSLTLTDQMGCSSVLLVEDYISVFRPNPNFWANRTNICSGDEITFNFASQNVPISDILWDFGDGNTSSEQSPSHIYAVGGMYNVTLYLTDIYGCDSLLTKQTYINVQNSPEPEFMADQTVSMCYPLIVSFEDLTDSSQVATRRWQLDNNVFSTLKNPSCTYLKPGDYDVSLTVTSQNGCSTILTKENFISVNGPWGKVNSPDTLCVNAPGSFYISDQENIYDVQWFFGDGGTSHELNTDYIYPKSGEYSVIALLKSDDLNTCNKYFFDTIYVRGVDANIGSDAGFEGCTPFIFNLSDNTNNAASRIWQIENFYTDTAETFNFVLEIPGLYNVSMFETNKYGCKDTVYSTLTVNDLPIVSAIKDTFVCDGNSVQLFVDGAQNYQWYPSLFLDDDASQQPVSTPDYDMLYSVTGTDSKGCSNYDEVFLKVINQPVFAVNDTAIVIGDTLNLSNYFGDIASYYWSPDFGINCDTCSNIQVSPSESTTYFLTIRDTANCFELTKSFDVDVYLKYSIDVPDAFTPNNDGINDKIFVDGWGIEHLLYFNIYNIYGELIYSSSDLYEGWNGFYKGKLQPVGTYRYVASVLGYDGEIRTKNGVIKIIY